MSIITSNKAEKLSPRPKIKESDESKPHLRRYNVKKEDNNQSNRWQGPRGRERRGGALARHEESPPRQKYKSYDYLPMKYRSERYRDEKRISNNFSHSPDYNKYRMSSQLPSSRRFSSTEDLDHSYHDYSSENSKKHACNAYKSYGDCATNYPHNNYDSHKCYNGREKGYDPCDTYNTRSYHTSKLDKPKKTSFSKNYINNNRSNTMKRYSPSDENRHGRRYEDETENFPSSYNDRNAMSLKSTYRTDENVPHSGTRLESHRKQIDKYCTGNRFRESHNSDMGGQYKSSLINKSKKTNNGAFLPQSPKSGSFKKSCHLKEETFDDRKYKFYSPQRSNKQRYEGLSDDESCYFENCKNSNNEYLKKPPIAYRNETKGYGTSSEGGSSSSAHISNEKPTESIPISLSSPKIDPKLKSLNSNIKDISKTNTITLPKKDNMKDYSTKHRHSCHLARHHSAHRRH